MEKVTLGWTGMEVSRLCLGSMGFGWTATEEESFAVLDAFVEAGGNFIDTADVYSNWVPGHEGGESESIIGRWMQARGNRKDLVIATKVRGRMWPGADGEGLSKAHIMRAIEDSLRRLQTDYIDLYQAHSFDRATHISETLRTFRDLIKDGKVRFVGASNYPPPELIEALSVSRDHRFPPFVSLQPHHSLVHRREFEIDLRPVTREWGLAVIPYSPLAAGFLTGKYQRDAPAPKSARASRVRQYMNNAGWGTVEALQEIAARHGVAPAAVALRWSMTQEGITAPIVGANTRAQLAEQLASLDLALSAEDNAKLNFASLPFLNRVPGR